VAREVDDGVSGARGRGGGGREVGGGGRGWSAAAGEAGRRRRERLVAAKGPLVERGVKSTWSSGPQPPDPRSARSFASSACVALAQGSSIAHILPQLTGRHPQTLTDLLPDIKSTHMASRSRAPPVSKEIILPDNKTRVVATPKPDGQLLVMCPRCSNGITLPRTGNPHRLFVHWEGCVGAFATPTPASELPDHTPSRLTISETPVRPQPADTLEDNPSDAEDTPRALGFELGSRPFEPLPALFPGMAGDCPGFDIRLERAWTRYPHARHQDEDLSWFPVKVDKAGHVVTVKSTKCTGTKVPNQPCTDCATVCHSNDLKVFLERIIHAPEHTPYRFLSFEQLLELVNKYKDECQRLRTQVRLEMCVRMHS
jgi:hypothetical protein